MILFLFLFDPSQLINLDTLNRQQAPVIAAYENYVHVLWEDERDSTCDFDIYCRTSTDGGQSFDYEAIVNYQHPKNQRNPAVDIYDDVVFVCFEDYQSYYDISFAKSTDHGQSFTPSIVVNDTTRYSQRYPKIALDDDGLIFVVWYDSYRDKDIYLSRSTNGGSSFLPSILVNSHLSDTFAQHQPDITVDNTGRVFVTFIDEPTNTIYVARSTDHGQSFDHLVQVCSGQDSTRAYPVLTTDQENRIFVGWEDKRSGDYDIYCARSTDHGNSFESEIMVNDVTNRHQRRPNTTEKNNEIYLVWEDYRSNNYDIYIAKSTDHGNSFLNSIRVNDYTQKSQRYPCIASSNRLHITWEDYRHTSADIYATGGQVATVEESKGVIKTKILANPNRFNDNNTIIFDAIGRKVSCISKPGVYFLNNKERTKIIVIR